MTSQPSRKRSRVFSFRPAPTGTIKDATAHLVDDAHGVRRGAELCRGSASSLSNYSNPEEHSSYMPVDVVLQLESSTGARHVTEYLVAAHGGVFVDLGTLNFDNPKFFKSTADVMSRAGALAKTVADGMEDGNLDSAECAAALAELDELMRSAGGLRVMLTEFQANKKA